MVNHGFKLNVFLSTLLLSWLSVHGMIEKPYKPSFGARHPMLTRIAKAGSIGAGIYLAARYAEHLAPDLFKNISEAQAETAGLIAFLGTYAYQARKKPNLVDAILCDPCTALKCAQRISSKCLSAYGITKSADIEDVEKFRATHTALLKQFESQCPFFLLDEYTAEKDQRPCLLSRMSHPEYREEFGHQVTQALLRKLAEGRPVHYASFACNGCFQELVIITKTLAQKPDARIHIGLISTDNAPFVNACNALNLPRQISENSAIDLAPHMDQIIQYWRRYYQVDEFSDADISKDIPLQCMMVETGYQQFIAWLKKTFPRAQITLNIHDTVESTLKYLEQNGGWYPDVISAVYISDGQDTSKNSMREDYQQLCRATLQKKPDAYNVWLTKSHKQGFACLVTYYLQRIQCRCSYHNFLVPYMILLPRQQGSD